MSLGVEAVGMESTSDGANDPLDEAGRSSLAGLQAACGIRMTLCDTEKEIINHSGAVRGIVLPLLDPSASPVGEAFLFLSPSSGRESSFSSSSLGKESASGPSDDESDITWRRELLRVPVAFFLAFFSGTT